MVLPDFSQMSRESVLNLVLLPHCQFGKFLPVFYKLSVFSVAKPTAAEVSLPSVKGGLLFSSLLNGKEKSLLLLYLSY